MCLEQERLLHEAKKSTDTIQENRTAPIIADISLSRNKALNHTEASATVSMSPSPALSAPLFTKKAKSQEEAKTGIDKTAAVNETVKAKNKGNDASDREGKAGEIRQVQSHHPQDPSIKSSNKQEVKKLEASIAQPSRPSNPFLKSSIK